jgi:hypothetical protein
MCDKKSFMKVLGIVSLIYTIIYAFINLAVAISGYVKLNKYTDELVGIQDDWKNTPITAIEVQNSGVSCSSGFSPIVENTWPGTDKGCNCIAKTNTKISTSHRNKIFSGTCTSNETQSGCTTVNELSAVPLKTFKGKVICGKREGDNFIKVERPD